MKRQHTEAAPNVHDVWHMTIFYNYVSRVRRSMFQSECLLTENSYTLNAMQKPARYVWHYPIRINHQVRRTHIRSVCVRFF